VHPSEVSGDGIEAGIIPSPVQVRAYSDAEQASWHASVTTCPSGPRIVPSCMSTEPPLGTLQMLWVGVAQQPTLLASPLEVKLAGQLHEPVSALTCAEPSGDASVSVDVFAEFDPHAVRESNSVDATAARIGLNAGLVMRPVCRQSTRSSKPLSTVERPASDRDHSTPPIRV